LKEEHMQKRAVRDGRGWRSAAERDWRILQVMEMLDRNPHLTNPELALELGVTASTVARYRKELSA
jgi:predicted DNA-binding transcriptional regulator YafY